MWNKKFFSTASSTIFISGIPSTLNTYEISNRRKIYSNNLLIKTVNGIAVINRPQTPIVLRQHKHPVRPPIGPRIEARRPAPPGPRPAGTTGRPNGRAP
jgi:hypothetical protein